MRFWECSPRSQNTSRTVYLSSLMLRQHQVFCVPEAPRVLEGSLGFCLCRAVLVCTVGSLSLSQCSLHIPCDGEYLSVLFLTHGRIAVSTLHWGWGRTVQWLFKMCLILSDTTQGISCFCTALSFPGTWLCISKHVCFCYPAATMLCLFQ